MEMGQWVMGQMGHYFWMGRGWVTWVMGPIDP